MRLFREKNAPSQFVISGPEGYQAAVEWLKAKKVLVEVAGPMRMLARGLSTKVEWRFWKDGNNVNLHQTFTKYGLAGQHPSARCHFFFFPADDWDRFLDFVNRVDGKVRRMKANGTFKSGGGNGDPLGDDQPYLGILLVGAGEAQNREEFSQETGEKTPGAGDLP